MHTVAKKSASIGLVSYTGKFTHAGFGKHYNYKG